MKFTETEAQFRQLKAKYDAGDLPETDFKARLQDLMVQDEQGRWWMIGYETGQWYVHDGGKWVQAKPPVPQGQPTATTAPPEMPAVTWTKPEESVPGSQAQPPRPWVRIGAGIVASAVVIVVIAQLAGRCQPTQTASPTASPTMTDLPAPTPTHTAIATMAPTATLTPLIPLFFDDFGNAASGWPDNYSDQYCERGYEGGEYHILSKTEGIIVASYPRSFDNFALEVDARELDGPDGGTYGVLLRQAPTTNYQAISRYYYVWVDPVHGTFGVQKWQDAWTELKAATASTPIQRGTGTNHIRVECIGPQIVVYMNNIQVASVTDNDFAAGWIGLSAAGNGTHAHFDNLQVRAVQPGIYDRVQPTPTSPISGEDIKLAILAPLSGAETAFGTMTRAGALLAIEEWNAGGGVLGRKLAPIIEDSQCEADPAIRAANKVIDEDKVKFIIGEVCSRASIPVSEIANNRGILQISPTSTNPNVTVTKDGKTKEYVFRACFIDPFQGTAGAKFALDYLRAKTAFIMSDQSNVYGKDLAEYFDKAFVGGGGRIVGRGDYDAADTDFSAILSRVADAKPDVIYLPDYYNTVNLVARQAKQKGITTAFLGGDGWASLDLDLKAAAGGFFTSQYAPDSTTPAAVAFQIAFSRKYKDNAGKGVVPDALAALAYDATNILLQSIQKAGSDDPTKVKDAMAKIRFDGVSGQITFDAQHNPVKPAAIVAVTEAGARFTELVTP